MGATPGPFARLAIVGLGLIGSSVARAARRAWPGVRIVGVDLHLDVAEAACAAGVIDAVAADAGAAAQQSDLVVLAVPVGAMAQQLKALQCVAGDFEARGTVVTDVGSTKASLLGLATSLFGGEPSWLVPGHPIAGSERSGWDAGRADLFERKRVLLCPGPAATAAARRVQQFWEALGARVDWMDALAHDTLLAQTSHLPHILAYALVDTLIDLTPPERLFHHSGGGFRDMTRLASSDAVMWRDIAVDNRAALLAVLDAFQGRLSEWRAEIAAGDAAALQRRFERAKQARDDHLKAWD